MSHCPKKTNSVLWSDESDYDSDVTIPLEHIPLRNVRPYQPPEVISEFEESMDEDNIVFNNDDTSDSEAEPQQAPKGYFRAEDDKVFCP